jgi:AcrR family transcriptional regulator
MMAADQAAYREGDEPSLRADAERNRRRILEAARAVFGEAGLDAPLEAIAQRAGVGIATLYRRFPTRDDLVAASFAPRMAEYVAAGEAALRGPDPWVGLRDYVERVCAMQAADRGLTDVLAAFPTAKALEEQRARAYRGFAELVRRAQAQGTLRADFVPEDLVLLLMANAGVVRATREAAPDAWRRFVALVLDGFRADGAGPLPPPPAPAQVYRAMLRLGRPRTPQQGRGAGSRSSNSG